LVAENGAEISYFEESGEQTILRLASLSDEEVELISRVLREVGKRFGMNEVDDTSSEDGFSILVRQATVIMGHLNALSIQEKHMLLRRSLHTYNSITLITNSTLHFPVERSVSV
jgi:hypothetical protein